VTTGLATLALALGFATAPASAANPYTPSEEDFADCPPKPAGASEWKCYVMTALDGQFRLKNMKVRINHAVRLTVAQGKVNGQSTAQLGGVRAEPMPFVTGVLGTPLEIPDPTGWKVKIEPTGHASPGILFPSKIGLKARIIGDGLGDNCWIGSNDAPVIIAPHPVEHPLAPGRPADGQGQGLRRRLRDRLGDRLPEPAGQHADRQGQRHQQPLRRHLGDPPQDVLRKPAR
jgi:hypothetical protein